MVVPRGDSYPAVLLPYPVFRCDSSQARVNEKTGGFTHPGTLAGRHRGKAPEDAIRLMHWEIGGYRPFNIAEAIFMSFGGWFDAVMDRYAREHQGVRFLRKCGEPCGARRSTHPTP